MRFVKNTSWLSSPLSLIVCLLSLLSLTAPCRSSWGPVGCSPVWGSSPVVAKTAIIRLTVEPNAKVRINGQLTSSTGRERVFETPPLFQPGHFRIDVDGVVKTVVLNSGDNLSLSFTVENRKDWRETGVEGDKLQKDSDPTYKRKGNCCDRDEIENRLKSFSDDSQKPWLTFIGPTNLRDPAVKTFRANSLVGDVRLNDEGPDHWMVRTGGFKVDPNRLTVVLQRPDGKVIGKVVDPTPDDLGRLIGAIRKPNPDYDPTKDPDPTKGLTAVGIMEWVVQNRLLLIALGVGGLILVAYLRRGQTK